MRTFESFNLHVTRERLDLQIYDIVLAKRKCMCDEDAKIMFEQQYTRNGEDRVSQSAAGRRSGLRQC
jgi:hypothetical protein